MKHVILISCALALLLAACGAPARTPAPTRAPAVPASTRAPATTTAQQTTTPADAGTFRLEGRLDTIDDDALIVDGVRVSYDPARLAAPVPAPGDWLIVNGQRRADGNRFASEVTSVAIVEIAGRLERIERDRWIIDGTPVIIAATTRVSAPPRPGSFVRALARPSQNDNDDDDTNDGIFFGLQIERASEITIVGQVTAITGSTIVINDDRTIPLSGQTLIGTGVAVGSPVRLVARVSDDDEDDDDDAFLIVERVNPLPAATVRTGTLEAIGVDFVIISGERLRIGRGVPYWNLRAAIGRPVRLII
ncbi:MAG TPA: DUF5666 domain-containing protein, partial [Roseiflexaceae bacterium]|nr:DUF5666 domain-containing protein [Roseiflexaceae bacterium]